ncbi:MAG: hypothetical protein ACOYOU_09035 [Kiritimatiellia bacterium]
MEFELGKQGKSGKSKEKAIHEQGLVSVLKQLHDDLDAAVFEAYGWSDLSRQGSAKSNTPEPLTINPDPTPTILTRLVTLNAARAAEESAGQIRWLRPDYQSDGVTVQQFDGLAMQSSGAPTVKPSDRPTVRPLPGPSAKPCTPLGPAGRASPE